MQAAWIVGVVGVLVARGAHADPAGPAPPDPSAPTDRVAVMAIGGLAHLETTNQVDELGDPTFETFGSLRLTVGWEPAPTPYPDRRGYRVAGALVPELVVGAQFREDRAEGLLGAGLRAELRIIQREGGLLRINARSALYVGARGMVVGDDRDVVLEGVFGDYFSFGESPLRFGFEVGAQRRSDAMEEDRTGLTVQLFVGYGRR